MTRHVVSEAHQERFMQQAPTRQRRRLPCSSRLADTRQYLVDTKPSCLHLGGVRLVLATRVRSRSTGGASTAGGISAIAASRLVNRARTDPSAFAFLDQVEADGAQPGPWADQGAVVAAFGWDRGDSEYRWAKPGQGNHFLTGTSWLPPGWNQPHLDRQDETELYIGAADSYTDRPGVGHPHALHFMGVTPTARYRRMGAVTSTPIQPVGH